jgi:hypothetical protein
LEVNYQSDDDRNKDNNGMTKVVTEKGH